MPKSLVTGGAGFIGSNLVDLLIDNGHEVIVIDNESAELNEKFYWNVSAKNYKLDICDYESIRPLFNGIDFVFHLAAEARLQPAIINPLNAFNKNVIGTATVLQCSREANIKRFIYSSTSSGYGNNPIPNIETQTDDCLNPYSLSKISAEKICQLYTKLYGLKTIIFRYFNVYGERSPSSGQYALVLGIFFNQYRNNLPLTIVGDGTQKRDFVNVKDVASINLLASQKDIDDIYYGQVFNVSNGYNISILEIANLISDNHVFIDRRIGEAENTLADMNKTKNVFNWTPSINLKEWILKEKSRLKND